AVARHRELLPQMEVFTYPDAGHAFNRDVPGDTHYHAASARLAWDRTLAFFGKHLAGA
ncbi:MAG: dienelactone hydrolase family protein, partial [Xanthomonadaceae bacterium]|nr:dienelactone hydrolase family protein [Xanthomonadaceae bacterium]